VDEYQGLAETFMEVLSMPLPDLDEELFTSGQLDSMAIIALVVELEDKFNIEIATDDLDLASFSTVRGMVTMIRRASGVPVPRHPPTDEDHSARTTS
jgi:acyl carrier protein